METRCEVTGRKSWECLHCRTMELEKQFHLIPVEKAHALQPYRPSEEDWLTAHALNHDERLWRDLRDTIKRETDIDCTEPMLVWKLSNFGDYIVSAPELPFDVRVSAAAEMEAGREVQIRADGSIWSL